MNLSDFLIYGLEVYDDFLPALNVDKDLRRISSTKIKATMASKEEKIVHKTHPSFRPCNFSHELFIKIYTAIACPCVYFPLTFHDTRISFKLFRMQLDFLTLD